MYLISFLDFVFSFIYNSTTHPVASIKWACFMQPLIEFDALNPAHFTFRSFMRLQTLRPLRVFKLKFIIAIRIHNYNIFVTVETWLAFQLHPQARYFKVDISFLLFLYILLSPSYIYLYRVCQVSNKTDLIKFICKKIVLETRNIL